MAAPRAGTLTLTLTLRHAWLLRRGVVVLGKALVAVPGQQASSPARADLPEIVVRI